MCGIAGFLDLTGRRQADAAILDDMMAVLAHRGPDAKGCFIEGPLAIGFLRLSIVDVEGGSQPFRSEDGSIVVFCNGEVLNHADHRNRLLRRGHTFRSRCDIEVIAHLYEEAGIECLNELDGQFAAVIFDRSRNCLFLVRDHCGVAPLHYAEFGGTLMFASEIKALLQHPLAERKVDLEGLDQILTFPGLVSPRTMFEGIRSLQPGHYLQVRDGTTSLREYWDIDYPLIDETTPACGEERQVDELAAHLERAVALCLQSDVPVGVYLSGGLDSALIAAMMKRSAPDCGLNSLSIVFSEPGISETKYQRLVASQLNSDHEEIRFEWSAISDRLARMVRHAECPVKETYNTCMLALSDATRQRGVKVILGGQGADELFAGYIGYRFDQSLARSSRPSPPDERATREALWGDAELAYERNYAAHRRTKAALYSHPVRTVFPEIDCTRKPIVNGGRVRGRHILHQRSYLDFKLRLSDHLLGDHGDRMIMANSVEGRYPFLSRGVVEFARLLPPELKLSGFREKHILKEVGRRFVPRGVAEREKFGFRAPGSPYLLAANVEWIDDMLSKDRIAREGYFDPNTVECLKAQYRAPGFSLHPHLDDDLLLIVLTFGLFLEIFRMPALGSG